MGRAGGGVPAGDHRSGAAGGVELPGRAAVPERAQEAVQQGEERLGDG